MIFLTTNVNFVITYDSLKISDVNTERSYIYEMCLIHVFHSSCGVKCSYSAFIAAVVVP